MLAALAALAALVLMGVPILTVVTVLAIALLTVLTLLVLIFARTVLSPVLRRAVRVVSAPGIIFLACLFGAFCQVGTTVALVCCSAVDISAALRASISAFVGRPRRRLGFSAAPSSAIRQPLRQNRKHARTPPPPGRPCAPRPPPSWGGPDGAWALPPRRRRRRWKQARPPGLRERDGEQASRPLRLRQRLRRKPPCGNASPFRPRLDGKRPRPRLSPPCGGASGATRQPAPQSVLPPSAPAR